MKIRIHGEKSLGIFSATTKLVSGILINMCSETKWANERAYILTDEGKITYLDKHEIVRVEVLKR